MYPAQGFADELPDIVVPQEQRFNVAFIQRSIPIYLYKDVPPVANVDVSALREAIIAHARSNPYLRVIPASEIDSSFRNSDLSQTDAFMQAEIDMGYARNFMDNQNNQSAIELTRRVIENYSKSLMQFYQPKSVSQAYQLLAYALIAQYQEDVEKNYEVLHPARLAFLEMIRLTPYLMMLEGRQSPERVAIYDEALELFLSNEAYRQTDQKDASMLAHKLHADILILARIVEDKSGELYLELDEYNVQHHEMIYHRQKIDISSHEQMNTAVADTATMILSRSYSCLKVKEETPVIQSARANRVFLDAGAGYSVFIKYPTSDVIHNVGGYVFVSYLFDEHFFVRVGAEIQGVLQDVAHELYDPFEMYQFPFMVGISQDWTWARIYLATGLDLGFTSSYTIVKSTVCKTFGTDDIECSKSDVTKNRTPFSLFVDFALGAAFGRDPFYVSLEGVISVTAYLSGNSRAFKHPAGLRLGLEYWF